MILVDTSVWIDLFRNIDSPQVRRLEHCIRDRQDLALCGIVLTECLQGIRHDAQFANDGDTLRVCVRRTTGLRPVA